MTTTLKEYLDAAQLAYAENADYEESGSVAKAKLFITACRRMLGLRPSDISDATSRMTFQSIEKQMNAAQAYVVANDTAAPKNTSAITVFSLEGFR